MSGASPDETPIVAANSRIGAKQVVIGALVNLLGILAGLSFLLFWIAATRLYGTTRVGEFAVAFALIELCRQFASSGFSDGIVLYFSRDVGRGEDGRERMVRALSTAIWLIAAIGFILFVVVRLGGDVWVASFTNRPVLLKWAPILVLSVPLFALAEVLVAATRAHMVMKWHALILGGVKPGLLLLFAILFYGLDQRENGLAWAWLASSLGTAAVAVLVFMRQFGSGLLINAVARPRWHRSLLNFSVPQNLNMTFNFFATKLDILMLGALGVASAQIAFYAAGVQIATNLRSIKVAFAHSFGPVISRYHADQRTAEIQQIYGRLSRLALTAVLPVAILVGILRGELFGLFDPAFATDNQFVFFLLALPILTCAVGLSGNLIVMTGHVGWNLFNSIVAAAANLGLNLWLIPIYGLSGAAMATLSAALLVHGLMIAEAAWLLKIRTQLLPRLRPLSVAIIVAALAAVCQPWLTDSQLRIGFAIVALAIYGLLAVKFVLKRQEREQLRQWVGAFVLRF